MTLQATIPLTTEIDHLAKAAAALGYEIVDISVFLDDVEGHAREQRSALADLGRSAVEVSQANADVSALVDALAATSEQALRDVQATVTMVRYVGN